MFGSSNVPFSLRAQLLTFTAALVMALSCTVLLLVLFSSGSAIRETVNQQMRDGVENFISAIYARREQLVSNASLLVSDFGFKQAVASNDADTIQSMLENHGSRVKADVMVIVDLKGRVVTSTSPQLTRGQVFGYESATQQVRKGEVFADFLVIGDAIFHMVLVPVRTPRLSAMAGIGIRVRPAGIREWISEPNIHLTFANGLPGEEAQWVVETSLPDLSSVVEAIRSPDNLVSLIRLPFQRVQTYSSREIDLSSESSSVKVFMSEDLSPYFTSYEVIRNQILLIAILVLIVAVIGSFIISQRLTKPLVILAAKAREIARGVYSDMSEIPATSSDIATLTRAFRRMKVDLAEREERILFQASHDSLTGLLNRDSMMEAVSEVVDSDRQFMLLGLNLVGFKTVNDTLGIEIGDECLVTVAKRLKKVAMDGIASRHSADEFSLLLPITGEQETTAQKILMCQRVLNEVSAPMQIDDISLTVDYRAGFIVFPDQAESAEQLLRRGKVALEHAITTSTPLYYFREGQDKVHLKKVKILRYLKETLQNDDDQLEMYYQPKYNVRTGQIEKAEALIRWFHPEEGFIPPDMFIELAEQTGLIGLVTSWVIGRVLDDQAEMKRMGISLQLSINMSAQDLSNDNLRVLIDQKLIENNLNAADICLEVTERDMMTDVEKSLDLLNYYRSRGFRLSIDDYGVGYSALSKLAMMPVHELKIDKCFILRLASRADDQIIVRSTVSMAHELGLSVIAEGVEDKESLDFLGELGCDYIQGYFIAKPMSRDALGQWLSEFSADRLLEGK